jgi:heme A synthase
VLLALALIGALVLTYKFPIHIHLASKIYMGSVVLYLMATLLPRSWPPPQSEWVPWPVSWPSMRTPIIPARDHLSNWPLDTHWDGWFDGRPCVGTHHPYVPLPLVAAGVVLWAGTSSPARFSSLRSWASVRFGRWG